MSFVIDITFAGETRTIEDSKPELTVGRSTPATEVDVDLWPDKSVSRKHFLIKLEYNMSNAKNEAWIVDLGSSRGTMINGKKVTNPVKITREDVVKAGDTEVCVKIKTDSKKKNKLSFQEKVAARSDNFGEANKKKKNSNASKSSDRPTQIAAPPEEEAPPPPPSDETILASSDEITPSLMAALTAGAHSTEAAGFVTYSIEGLANAVNRYARENKMRTLSASVVQEGKGSSACFRALVVFQQIN